MRLETVKSLGFYGNFDICSEKIHPPTPKIEGTKIPPAPKNGTFENKGKWPRFFENKKWIFICKNHNF